MTLKEFDQIRPYLKDDVTITIGEPKPKTTLIKQTWGNHDGRYNMLCKACGWVSRDIHPGRDQEPKYCPQCRGEGVKEHE